MTITMGALKEGLSNFVNKIKSIFGRKKITEEKSADLFSTLTASPATEVPETGSGYPYINHAQPKASTDTHEQDTQEPTAMAA